MSQPSVTVIVPARNADATLPATLAGLAGQRGVDPFAVTVVESGPRCARTRAQLAALDGHRNITATLLHNPGGEPAGSRNLGVRASRSAAIAFTDADCVPDPEWLATGLAGLADVDLLQGRVLAAGPHGRWDRTLSVGHESGLYETANLFLRRGCFDRVGGFATLAGHHDERPFGEDTLFAWRARRAGARTGFAGGAVVRHAVFPRGPGAYIAEQRRRGHFPGLVREVPELRGAFLHRGVFLSARSARFDLAVLALGAAALMRRPAPALVALPYLRDLPRRPHAALVEVAADGTGAAALLLGSLRTGTVVL